MKAYPYKRNRRGFTVTEFLAVVAILGVLLAAGIPTVLSLRKTIRIAKYDGIAREIYVAAQNSLSRLAANGMDNDTMKKLSDISDPNNGVNKMSETAPKDYKGEATWKNDQYYYAVNGSNAMTALLPIGSIDDSIRVNGHYVVEYNVVTNIIYGVFYSDSEFTYTDVANKVVGDKNFREDQDIRKEDMVGYYGGSTAERNPTDKCKPPVITITNNNQLFATISGVEPGCTLEVTLFDGKNTVTLKSDQIDRRLVNNGNGTYTLLMDSLDKDSQFKDLFSELTPGADITITAIVSKSACLSASAKAETNSLFADRTGDTVKIAYSRHLQNLDQSFSNVEGSVTSATQSRPIDWVSDREFESINNPNLAQYYGSGMEIRELRGKNGLFEATHDHMLLSNIRVVNQQISNPDSDAFVGGLVGTAGMDTQINNCGVYYMKLKPNGTVDFAAYKDPYGISAPYATAGGLVGQAPEGCTITRSFSALPFLHAKSGAELISSANNCIITESYANCDDLTSGLNYFLTGSNNRVSHCYGVANVQSTDKASFVNGGAGNWVNDSYYAVSHREGEVTLDLTEYCTFTDNVKTDTNHEGLKQWKVFPNTEWFQMIPPLTHPYREMLDGRHYPYPVGCSELDHYGSWPADDGVVWVTVNMELLNNPAEDANNAGIVTVTVNGEEKYNSTTSASNRIPVAPGSEITVKIKARDGYEYVDTWVLTDRYQDPEKNYTISKDTTLNIRFRQKAFTLTCSPVENAAGNSIQFGQYYVYLTSPQKTLTVTAQQEEQVDTGSTVVVRPERAQGFGATVVWYEAGGVKTFPKQNEDGTFSFPMPAADTVLHVRYTTEVVTCNIDYYLMGTDGRYPNTATSSATEEIGVGSQVNQTMMEAMAESSKLPLVRDGEHVRYLTEAIVTRYDNGKDGEELYHSKVDAEDNLTIEKGPYDTTSADDNGKTYHVKIYIARRQYKVTLIAGPHISGVGFGEEEKKPGITKKFYYGATVTAAAEVETGFGFTFWNPEDPRFFMSPSPNYEFTVPHYDLTLTASAELNQRMVTINLQENGESWLSSSDSRQVDPITLTLVNSLTKAEYPMLARTDPDISYAMQAVVPRIQEHGHGYYVRVNYASGRETWLFASGGENEAKNEKLLLIVRNQPVTYDAKFYSVTYHPNLEKYKGTAPQGGTYPEYTHVMVQGNTGLLRNDTDNRKIFTGWLDYVTGSTGRYHGGEDLILIRQTDLFAQWKEHLNVTYDGNGADGGELPVAKNYGVGDRVTVQFGSLTKKGHRFLGWSTTEDGPLVYSPNGLKTFQMTHDDVTLYAVWEKETYTVTFHNPDESVNREFTQEYDTTVDPSSLEVEVGPGKKLVGWSLTLGGDVAFGAEEQILVTGNMHLYPCLTDTTIIVTYKSMNGQEKLGTAEFGKGVPGYLYCAKAGNVTAWSSKPNGQGDLYFCDENGRSESAYTFMVPVTLYAVTGKVYNHNQRLWFDTLGDAVRSDKTINGDTLIVYRNTTELKNIWFNKSLYVLASGNRKVTWDGNATNDSGVLLRVETPSKLSGCMCVGPVTVHFGTSDNRTLSMDGSSLTFDANKQSRVISLDDKATFHMYDGVTLTNGERPEKADNPNEGNEPSEAQRAYYGGGVYADAGAVFNMHGGTISYCKAYKGGGVYLYKGSKMYMGDMVTPTSYSATAIYYTKDGKYYINAPGPVTADNYKEYLVTEGNPEICYNTSTREFKGQWSFDDGGGGILMLDLKDGDLVLYKGSIHNNVAMANGGGIVSDSGGENHDAGNKAKLRIYEVDISHNTAHGYGGGIFQWQGIVYIYNSIIRQNHTYKSGGGIYLHHWQDDKDDNNYDKSTVEFHFGEIADNSADENGGGVYVEARQVMTITHGNLVRNEAKINGGGAYAEKSDKFKGGILNFEGGTVSENTAEKNGGGVYSDGIVLLRGGTLSGNKAEQNGGGVYSTGEAYLVGGTVCNNIAEHLGGGIISDGNLYLSNGSLYGNEDKDYQNPATDEDSVNPGDNDIYLMGDNVITIPKGDKERDFGDEITPIKFTIPTEGILLSGEERVAVDCDNDASERFDPWPDSVMYHKIVAYEDPNNYLSSHAAYFTYYGTRSSAAYVAAKKNLEIVTHETLNLTTGNQQGLYLREVGEGNKTSTVILDLNYPECPPRFEEERTVGTTLNPNDLVSVTSRTGYYIAGWSRTKDAAEEDYVLYYDPMKGQWAHTYDSVNKKWTNWDNAPSYQVRDYVSQTLYAMWKPCVVMYHLGDAPNTVTIHPMSVGPKVILLNPVPMTFEKDGETYLFQGWAETPNCHNVSDVKYQATQQMELDKNRNLYAVWTVRPKDSFVVTYYYNGGSYEGKPGKYRDDIPYTKDQELTLPSGLTRANKVFLGWSTEQGASVEDYKAGQVFGRLESDMTFYAVWADAVTVTHDPNYSEAKGKDTILAAGESITIQNAPARNDPDYAFLGWADTADAKEPQYQPGETFGPVYENKTLFAVWGKKVTLTLNWNYEGAGETHTQSAIQGQTVTIDNVEVPIREGYTFKGWSQNEKATEVEIAPQGQVKVTDNLTLYAVWKVPFTISFEDPLNGQPVPAAQSITVGEKISLDVLEKDGYVFKGWVENRDTDTPFVEYTLTKAENVTLYAVWGRNVTITFQLNYEGAGEHGIQPATQGETVTISVSAPEREGYTFKGWSTDEKATEAEIAPQGQVKVTDSLTLYAVWEKKPILTFNLNGASETQIPASQTVEKGQEITIQADDPTREGYEFAGWAETADSTEGKYHKDGKILMDQDKTIYAVWEKLYTISFVDPSTGDPVLSPQSVTFGKTITLDTPPTKDGYVFKGWAEDPATEAPFMEYTHQKEQDVILYAVWEIKTYTITFDLVGGTWQKETGSVQKTVTAGDYTCTGDLPTKQESSKFFGVPITINYDFVGWVDADNNTYSYNTPIPVKGDITLRAEWTISR